jgi:hypothetical protein
MTMKPQALARLFLEQLRAQDEGAPRPGDEPNALFLWEELICHDAERAWPVFDEILARVSDDETLEQIWYRLRLLLQRHFAEFRDRAEQLLARHKRLALIAGPGALEPATYEDKPTDRATLIEAYRALHRTNRAHTVLENFAQTDPQRSLALSIEIIHRGVAKGWAIYDVMSPLGDTIAQHGAAVIDQIEQYARESVAVRRALWRLKRHLRYRDVDPAVRERLEHAAGTTTEYTDLDAPVPPAQRQLDADEALLAAWFENEQNFWAFSELNELCDEDPQLAWSITLELIEKAADRSELAYIAAGPLEDLVRNHPAEIWDDLELRAHTDERVLDALRGVWVFADDGEGYARFRDLMETIDAEPN